MRHFLCNKPVSMRTANRNYAVAAIHDAAPKWETEIQAIYQSLSEIAPAIRPALLVVPNFHGTAPLGDSKEFVSRLRQWISAGSEALLHGFTHLETGPVSPMEKPLRWGLSKLLTAAEGEFLDLEPAEIVRRLNAGRAVLEETLGVSPAGFVPPAWLRNRHLFGALKPCGFSFTEGHRFVYNLQSDTRVSAPALTFSGRTKSRAAASVAWASLLEKSPLAWTDVRLAIHPADWTDPRLRQAVLSLVHVIAKTHRFVSYGELLNR